jgi:hypothetical protein
MEKYRKRVLANKRKVRLETGQTNTDRGDKETGEA